MLFAKDKHVPIRGSWKPLTWGLTLISIGIITFVTEPSLLYRTTKMILKEHGESYTLWLKPNVEAFASFHLFNITNKEAFLAGREKLRVHDVGPYTYRMRFDYEERSFNHEDGTVTVHPGYFFDWDPSLNNRSENDRLVLPNVAVLLMASKFTDGSSVFNNLVPLNEIVKRTSSEPILEQTVKEFMRGGDNSLVKLASTLFSFWVKFDSIGYLDRVTDSEDDLLTIYTGQKNFEQAGLIASFNDRNTLSHLDAPCNRLEGASDGKKFGNDLKPDETLYVYHKSLCRTLPLVPAGPTTYSPQYLPTVPYTFPDNMFNYSETYPENKCYCLKGNCLPSGLSDASPCYLGFPAALSLPHFYKGDPALFENIEGLKPNADRHGTRIHLNPDTGIATNAYVRLQSNIVVNDISRVSGYESFSNMVVPLSWFNVEFYQLEDTIALRMFLAIRVCPVVEKILSTICVIAGIYYVRKSIQTIKPNQFDGTKGASCLLQDENFNQCKKNEENGPDSQTLLKRDGNTMDDVCVP